MGDNRMFICAGRVGLWQTMFNQSHAPNLLKNKNDVERLKIILKTSDWQYFFCQPFFASPLDTFPPFPCLEWKGSIPPLPVSSLHGPPPPPQRCYRRGRGTTRASPASRRPSGPASRPSTPRSPAHRGDRGGVLCIPMGRGTCFSGVPRPGLFLLGGSVQKGWPGLAQTLHRGQGSASSFFATNSYVLPQCRWPLPEWFFPCASLLACLLACLKFP